MSNNLQDLTALLNNRTGNKLTITKDSSLKNDLGFDSLDIIELASEIEDKFSIDVSDFRVMAEIKTVGDLAAFIDKSQK